MGPREGEGVPVPEGVEVMLLLGSAPADRLAVGEAVALIDAVRLKEGVTLAVGVVEDIVGSTGETCGSGRKYKNYRAKLSPPAVCSTPQLSFLCKLSVP